MDRTAEGEVKMRAKRCKLPIWAFPWFGHDAAQHASPSEKKKTLPKRLKHMLIIYDGPFRADVQSDVKRDQAMDTSKENST